MRLFTLCCLLFCLVTTVTATAVAIPAAINNPQTKSQPQQPPSDQVQVADDVSSELEGTVEVAFRIDASGKANILNINASNPKLIDYVVKKLGKIQLDKGDSQIGKVIKYRFVFKKQA